MLKRLSPYLIAFLILAVAILLRWAVDPLLGNHFRRFPLVAVVALITWKCGYRPAILVAIVGFFAFGFLYVEPRDTFTTGLISEELERFITYCITCALIIGIGAYSRVTRQRAEAHAARASETEQRLSSVLEQSPVGIGFFGVDGSWIICNRAMRRFVPEGTRIFDSHWIARWRVSTHQAAAPPLDNWPGAKALSGASISLDTLFKADDGTDIWTHIYAAPLLGAKKEIVGAVCIAEDVTPYKDAEKALSDRAEALQQSRAEIRELAATATALREQEKRRIARELHDELGQLLSGLKMDIAWLRNTAVAEQTYEGKLDTIEDVLDKIVAATRRISADLRPMMLDDLGIVPATEWLVQSFTERTGVPCELAISSDDLKLNDSLATTIYRILQESLTNIAKHARATRVEVSLERTNSDVTLSIRDNGAGFDMSSVRKPHAYGLLGLRERVYLLGGRVEIESEPGKGTSIEVKLPVDESPRD